MNLDGYALVLWDITCDRPVSGVDIDRVPAHTWELLRSGEPIPEALRVAIDMELLHDGCSYEVRGYRIDPKLSER